jgi:hypothetical protein
VLAGLIGLAGTTVFSAASNRVMPPSDPVGVLESALFDPPSATGIPVALPRLRTEVVAARSVFQRGRYTQVTTRLPELISTAIATRAKVNASKDIAAASGQLAEIYTLASELMVKLGHDHLAWSTADRALQAAYDSGDILTQATARRAWCIALRRADRTETAQQLVLDTATALEPQLRHGPEYLSVYGSLLSTAAYTAAVGGDRDTAHTLISEALDLASRLGTDFNHHFTAFGQIGVGLYRISIARVLGDSGTAIEAARQINPMAIPLLERRARYWSDVARSFHQWGKHEQCFQALLAAEHASPDEVRYRKPIHQITTSLLHHPDRARPTRPAGIRSAHRHARLRRRFAFAERLGSMHDQAGRIATIVAEMVSTI